MTRRVRNGSPLSLGGFLIAAGTGLAFWILAGYYHMNPAYAAGIVIGGVVVSAFLISVLRP